MGIACCNVSTFLSLTTSEWISVITLLVNSILAIWIARTIQNSFTNKRILKDHFINEVKDIRNDYSIWLNDLSSNKINPKLVTPWFKLMSIRIKDLMLIISNKYDIDKNLLNPYQNDLRELITDNEDYIKQYQKNELLILTEASQKLIIKFQQENNLVFNKIIVAINDYK